MFFGCLPCCDSGECYTHADTVFTSPIVTTWQARYTQDSYTIDQYEVGAIDTAWTSSSATRTEPITDTTGLTSPGQYRIQSGSAIYRTEAELQSRGWSIPHIRSTSFIEASSFLLARPTVQFIEASCFSNSSMSATSRRASLGFFAGLSSVHSVDSFEVTSASLKSGGLIVENVPAADIPGDFSGYKASSYFSVTGTYDINAALSGQGSLGWEILIEYTAKMSWPGTLLSDSDLPVVAGSYGFRVSSIVAANGENGSIGPLTNAGTISAGPGLVL